MSPIARIHAREVLDSRGHPTVECEVHTAGGHVGTAIVPSGASTGQAEALELRDGDAKRYDGRGVRRAVDNVNLLLGPALVGVEAADQQTVDERLIELDGTANKSKLGANAILAISLAAAHAAAASDGLPLFRHFSRLYNAAVPDAPREPALPLPMVNMISGGLHAGGNLDFQDVLIQPVGAAAFVGCMQCTGDSRSHLAPRDEALPLAEREGYVAREGYIIGLEWIVRVYRRLGELLAKAGYEGRLVGDEGGFGPRLADNRQAVEFVVRAIEAAGLRPGVDVTIALDVASTHFFDGSYYRLAAERNQRLTSDELIDRLAAWSSEFPITSIEDGLAEEDWLGWQALTRRLGSKLQLVGDDLFTTSEARIRRGIELGAANSVLIKVNQIGTLSETFAAMRAARSAGYTLIVSARSGETEDSTIADLAVGCAAEQIKIGSIVRSERLAKYNRLLRIAEEL